MLSDTELLLGLSRHLAAYQMSPERAALEQLEMAGRVFDLAFRLRGSGTNTAERVRAIALDAGIGGQTLRAVIATLEQMQWIAVDRDALGQPELLNEFIPAPSGLISSSPQVLNLVLTTPAERAALVLLRATSLRPILREDAFDAVAELSTISSLHETHAADALRYLTHTGLVREVITEADTRAVLYNPNIWTRGDAVAGSALKAADANGSREVAGLLEEVAQQPGIPSVHVKSTSPKWIAFAVSQGLVQRSVIQTSDGLEQGFLFTPHLTRDPFGVGAGGTAGDASGQVRQLVGSMIYAATFAEYRLDEPDTFIRALISRGVAGHTSNIGTDYPMLEKAGIVRVIPGSQSNRYRLELLQSEIAEDALTLLSDRAQVVSGHTANAAVLRAQRSYVHVERERAELAHRTGVDEIEQARLIAALREVPLRRTIGGNW